MTLILDGIRLRLPHLDLAVDATLTSGAAGLFGPSGSGKTTLLEIIAGLRPPDAGRVILNDRVLNGLPPRARRIGYVPQDETLFPHLTVRRNILYAASSLDDALIDALDLRPLLPRSVARLSGGERRRIAIARAMHSSPELLMLDEPLAGLDAPRKERIIELLRDVRARFRIPTLFVSHDRGEIAALCEEVVAM